MSTLSTLLQQARLEVQRKQELTETLQRFNEEADRLTILQRDLVDAQKLLNAISEENTVRTLEHITGVINNALAQIFHGKGRQVSLEKSLWKGRYAHLEVVLSTPSGATRSLDLQTGSGVNEVISFLFTVCLIAVRGGRRLLIMDELLSGVHPDAKQVIAQLMGVFADEGFQFLMVEYGLDSFDATDEDFGRVYDVTPDKGTTISTSYVAPRSAV